jgi:hypothetical protein
MLAILLLFYNLIPSPFKWTYALRLVIAFPGGYERSQKFNYILSSIYFLKSSLS